MKLSHSSSACWLYALLLIVSCCQKTALGFWSRSEKVLVASAKCENDTESGEAGTCVVDSGKPQRGVEIGHPFTPSDLYKAYHDIKSEYETKAFGPENKNNWQVRYNEDGIEVALLEHPSDPSCPYVRTRVVMPTSIDKCWDFLDLKQWDTNMPKMDPFYEGVSVFGEYIHNKVEMVLCHKRTKRIFAFSPRDLVFLSVTDEPLPDGTWVAGTVSVKTPAIPRKDGYTRAFQDSIAYYKPISENQTEVTSICRIDLNDSSEDGAGGMIPMWIYVKTVGKAGGASVSKMRDLIKEYSMAQ